MPSRAELDAAYRATSYFVDGPEGRLAIRIGLPCPALDRLLARHHATTWAPVTAHNPGSVALSAEENGRRHGELESCIGAWTVYPGESIADAEDWPAERSVLILAIDEANALRLARQFGQLAVVIGAIGTESKLLWTN